MPKSFNRINKIVILQTNFTQHRNYNLFSIFKLIKLNLLDNNSNIMKNIIYQ